MNGSIQASGSYAATPVMDTAPSARVGETAVPSAMPLRIAVAESLDTSKAASAPVKSVAAVFTARLSTPTSVAAVTDEPAARATGVPAAIWSAAPSKVIGKAGAASCNAAMPAPLRVTVALAAVIAGKVCTFAKKVDAVALSATKVSPAADDSTEKLGVAPVRATIASEMKMNLPWFVLGPISITALAQVPAALPSSAVAATCVMLPLPLAEVP